MAGLSRLLVLAMAFVLAHRGDGTSATTFDNVLCGATTAVWNPRLTTSYAGVDLSVSASNNWVPNSAASAGDGTVAQTVTRQDLADGTKTLQVNTLLGEEPQLLQVDDIAYDKERINIASLFLTSSPSARSTMAFRSGSGMKFKTKTASSSVGFCDDVRLSMLLGSPTQTPTPLPTPFPTYSPTPQPTPLPTPTPTPVPSTAAPTTTPDWDGVLCGAGTAVWNPRLTTSSVRASNNWVPNTAANSGDGTVAQKVTDLTDGATTIQINTILAGMPQRVEVDDKNAHERVSIVSLYATSSPSIRSTLAST